MECRWGLLFRRRHRYLCWIRKGESESVNFFFSTQVRRVNEFTSSIHHVHLTPNPLEIHIFSRLLTLLCVVLETPINSASTLRGWCVEFWTLMNAWARALNSKNIYRDIFRKNISKTQRERKKYEKWLTLKGAVKCVHERSFVCCWAPLRASSDRVDAIFKREKSHSDIVNIK